MAGFRRFLLLLVLAVALGALWLSRRAAPPPAAGDWERWPGQDPAADVPPPADPDFPRKGPPQPGEWLFRFKERGQTVAQYKDECRNRRREGRETIVLQPLGGLLDTHADTLEATHEYIALFYGCPVEVAPAVPLRPDTFVADRGQYDADRIAVDLRNRVPGKALVYAGFCREDLFAGDLNFVFGIGALRERVGVYSLARYGDPFDSSRPGTELAQGGPLFLKRTLKVASHEIGHILGMEHCVRYACNMNGSNSLSETDREPMHLCPECLEKARWNTGYDVKARYEKLAKYYEKAGLKAEAEFARRQAGKGR